MNTRLILPLIVIAVVARAADAGLGSVEARFSVHTSVLPHTATGELFGSSSVPGGAPSENFSGAPGPLHNSSRNYTGLDTIAGRELGPFNKLAGIPTRLWTASNAAQTANTYSAIDYSADGQTALYDVRAQTDHDAGVAAAGASDPWGYNDGFFDIFTELRLFDLEIETDEQKRANCIWESYLVDPNPGPFVKIDLSIIGEPGSSDDIEIEVETGSGVTHTATQIESMIRANLVVTPGHVTLASPVVFGYQITRPGPFAIDSGVRTAVAPVPEPASIACFGAGILGLAWKRRSSKKAVRT